MKVNESFEQCSVGMKGAIRFTIKVTAITTITVLTDNTIGLEGGISDFSLILRILGVPYNLERREPTA